MLYFKMRAHLIQNLLMFIYNYTFMVLVINNLFMDLRSFLPPTAEDLKNSEIIVHYLKNYLKWTPHVAYYYSVESTNFKARLFKTQDKFSKYKSFNDKIVDLHHYTMCIKFGIGRASYDASQEIRNNHLVRDEGVAC